MKSEPEQPSLDIIGPHVITQIQKDGECGHRSIGEHIDNPRLVGEKQAVGLPGRTDNDDGPDWRQPGKCFAHRIGGWLKVSGQMDGGGRQIARRLSGKGHHPERH